MTNTFVRLLGAFILVAGLAGVSPAFDFETGFTISGPSVAEAACGPGVTKKKRVRQNGVVREVRVPAPCSAYTADELAAGQHRLNQMTDWEKREALSREVKVSCGSGTEFVPYRSSRKPLKGFDIIVFWKDGASPIPGGYCPECDRWKNGKGFAGHAVVRTNTAGVCLPKGMSRLYRWCQKNKTDTTNAFAY